MNENINNNVNNEYCSQCGNMLNPQSSFCGRCGKPRNSQNVNVNNQMQPNNNQFQNNMNSNINPQQMVNNQSMNYQQQNNNVQGFQQSQNTNITNNQMYINDFELMDVYIGKNANKLKNGGFSHCTWFFGFWYLLYRKMWKEGFIWLVVVSIIAVFLGTNASALITIVANTIMAVLFKKMYIEHVKEEVNRIKNENRGRPREQLIAICRQKGGTTIIPIIIGIVLLAIPLVILIVGFITAFGVINQTINESQLASMRDSVQTIAAHAGKEYLVRSASGEDTSTITCATVGVNQNDYDTCTIIWSTTYPGEVEKVILKGKDGGKYAGYTCEGNMFSATCTK